MRRGVPLLALGLVVGACAFFAWSRRTDRVHAAIDACSRLLVAVPDAGAAGAAPAPARQPLLDTILAGTSVTRESADRARMKLHGVRFAAPGESDVDLDVHLLAREALVRGLKSGARERGIELGIEGELSPERGGADFLVTFDGVGASLQYQAPGAEQVTVSDPGPIASSSSTPALLLGAASFALLAIGGARVARAARPTP